MRLCSVDSCQRKSERRGYCMTHYTRVRKYGTAQEDKPIGRYNCPKRGLIVNQVKEALKSVEDIKQ